MIFNKHDDIMGKFTAELKVAKLSQAVDDKDQELFESQEIAAELLEALKDTRLNLAILVDSARPTTSVSILSQDWYRGGVDILEAITEAIRMAKHKEKP